MTTDVHDRLKGIVKTFLTDDDDNYEEIKSLVKSGKTRFVLNIYHFNNITGEFSSRLLNDPFTFFPPCEEAFQEAYSANLSDYGEAAAQKAKNRPKARLGLSGWFGSHTVSPRGLTSRLVNKLVSVEGIVTRSSLVKPKLVSSVQVAEETKRHVTKVHHDTMSISRDKYQHVALPKQDADGNRYQMEVGLCEYKDFQRFTIQEMPENAPSGELPRAVDVIVEEDLTDAVKPGDRVRVFGVYRCVSHKESGRLSGMAKTFVVCNNVEQLRRDVQSPDINPVEIREIRMLSERSDTFDVLARSIAPSLCGMELIKKGLLLQLLGGQRKELQDSIRLRGDIHVLLIGDPSCGKSQLLRFMMNTAPLALSTTGRGSSGVGLTAAVTVDRDSGERRLEAGAMVLADMGVVCIDEFDKMSPEDRVAIHEVMEQQTVTISKAGIQTSLNARCSVLSAANPLYGTFDETADLKRQISFPDSLLSRFDLIYVVRDAQSAEQDREICQQVLRQLRHRAEGEMHGPSGGGGASSGVDGGIIQPQLSAQAAGNDVPIWQQLRTSKGGAKKAVSVVTVEFLRKYVYYAKNHRQSPTLSDESQEEIAAFYAELRQKFVPKGGAKNNNLSIPTARSLEACIRLATAHAKLKMRSEVQKEDVKVAKDLLLFTLCGELPSIDEDPPTRRGGRRRNADGSDDDDDHDMGDAARRRRGRQPPAARRTRGQDVEASEEDDDESDTPGHGGAIDGSSTAQRRGPKRKPRGDQTHPPGASKLERKRTRTNETLPSVDEEDDEQQQVTTALSQLSIDTTDGTTQKRRRVTAAAAAAAAGRGKRRADSGADSATATLTNDVAPKSVDGDRQSAQEDSAPSLQPPQGSITPLRLKELMQHIVAIQQDTGRDNMSRTELLELVNQRIPRRPQRFATEEFHVGVSKLQDQNKLMDVQGMIWFI